MPDDAFLCDTCIDELQVRRYTPVALGGAVVVAGMAAACVAGWFLMELGMGFLGFFVSLAGMFAALPLGLLVCERHVVRQFFKHLELPRRIEG